MIGQIIFAVGMSAGQRVASNIAAKVGITAATTAAGMVVSNKISKTSNQKFQAEWAALPSEERTDDRWVQMQYNYAKRAAAPATAVQAGLAGAGLAAFVAVSNKINTL